MLRSAPLASTFFRPALLRPERRPPGPAEPAAAERVPCPHCGATGGYLLELDGAVYRVLEDEGDVDLLEEGDLEGVHTITCLECKRGIDGHAVLEAIRTRAPRIRAKATWNKHPHRVGNGKTRTTPDGRTLPVCPECGATHDFFLDIDGAAYRVLEDDDDTDLLSEAHDLLCARCNAVFDIA